MPCRQRGTASQRSDRRSEPGGAGDITGSTTYDSGNPFSIFAFGTYLNVERTAFSAAGGGSTGSSFDADLGGITAGVSYQATPELAVGVAFNYLATSVELDGLSRGSIDMDSLQGAVFASLALPNIFADAALTYGVNDYELDRPGVMGDRLTASPSGNTFTAAGRVGYLFDFGDFTAGPLAELTYAHASVGPYEESGDTLLTIGARRQELESLTAGTGVQIKAASALLGGVASPFLNVTVHHDFLDSARTITSYQTYAPTLPFRTQAGRDGDNVYGRVAGGVNFDMGAGLSASLTASTSFGRSGGNDHAVSASLKLRF
jgi:outer membrane autotransporter protein